MARIPYVDPEHAPAAVQEVFARLPVPLHIFRLMAHAESNFRPLIALGTSILGAQQLAPRLRELAILQVARLAGAEYEWVQHVPIARAAGVGEAEIAAIERGTLDGGALAPDDRALLAFTAAVVRGERVSDDLFGALRARLSPREIVELLLAIGYYLALARLMVTLDIDPDPPLGERVADAVERAVARRKEKP